MSISAFSSSSRRVVVLGLDGVPFTLLERLFENGIMPRLAEVAQSGSFLRMETTVPPISSVAWTSFMTGENPGAHGIFGFTHPAEGELALRLPSFDDIQRPTLWTLMPDKRTIVVNLPFTYPARPLNGALISGFVAPSLERAVYPPDLLPWLTAGDYRIDVDAVKGRTDRQGLISELFDTLSARERVILQLMNERPWDLFIAVVTGTDRLHHFFFDAAYDPSHPLNGIFIDYYRKVDRLVGELLGAIGGSARFIALSDHGFTRLKTQVYVNEILRRLGYLSFIGPNPTGLPDISPHSRAFAMEPGRIYLNSSERFGNGPINGFEAQALRDELRRRLESISLSELGIEPVTPEDHLDDPVFQAVLPKETIFWGDCLDQAPDLVLLPRDGYDLKAQLGVGHVTMSDIFTGTHTHDDAFLITDDPSAGEATPPAHITDVAGLVFDAMGPAGSHFAAGDPPH